MKKLSLRTACLMLLATGLVACGGGGGGGNGATGLAAALSALGSDFQMAFNQGRNDAPINVDLATLTLNRTAEPFEF
ncbi:hypothetical protein KX928_06450 [Roseobacter sp. YSTF-M11]|uniref:Lipoprotein n=1 Tax=Roseobacter insulae TaxID=2859783 RepID=A0A9X1FTL6_9RHOB|nr:hypothetical protein [Roseobacter insulae]MBW4707422.1 hypothetical protein [Roseobacter insulae]